MVNSKSRDSALNDDMIYTMKEVEIGTDENGEPLFSEVVDTVVSVSSKASELYQMLTDNAFNADNCDTDVPEHEIKMSKSDMDATLKELADKGVIQIESDGGVLIKYRRKK